MSAKRRDLILRASNQKFHIEQQCLHMLSMIKWLHTLTEKLDKKKSKLLAVLVQKFKYYHWKCTAHVNATPAFKNILAFRLLFGNKAAEENRVSSPFSFICASGYQTKRVDFSLRH